jgi:hypothetical protein
MLCQQILRVWPLQTAKLGFSTIYGLRGTFAAGRVIYGWILRFSVVWVHWSSSFSVDAIVVAIALR